ncbi:MAG: twin-arginine translocase TatA/TatE family subunit [Candidatus Thermoplasmatota archaeon]|nr:twin-arginine translocase TatA/TatE family subunit [Candidatus Thermoplasmatota archaeon]MCL5731754.1 twin-arginine translocase TatA/TatE family subunit [Candidatus Thermoplasmatota archaeon]
MAFDSLPDWLIIIAVVLILFGGAKKIPELARNLGRASGEYTRGKMELEREIRNSLNGTNAAAGKSEINYTEAAKKLGIDTNGKTEEQLKQEMASKLSEGR